MKVRKPARPRSATVGAHRREHWESVYRARPDEAMSWTQTGPSLSLQLIREIARPDDRLLDAGGGASHLARDLWDAGFHRLTVVDISAGALARARSRWSSPPEEVRWLRRDLAAEARLPKCDVWHDRAVFHFLVARGQRGAYVRNLRRTLVPGGVAILATFAPNGPAECSGLPVARYGPTDLLRALGSGFTLEASARERHRTPWGAIQPFSYAVLRRRPSAAAD